MTGRRRPAVLVTVALLCGVLAACGGGGSSGPDREDATSDRPNIVFLLVDDLDEVTTHYWDAMPKTKALIEERGMTFRNMFATDPVCCPARATLLTGMYPHNTRVFNSEGGLESFRVRASKWTFGVRMQQAGYRTAFLGKYLNGYELAPTYVPPGWDDWFGLAGKLFLTGYNYAANHNGTMERYGHQARDYQTDVINTKANEFIDEAAKGDKPFLLTLFPSAPHAPITPARRDKHNQFADDPLPDRKNYDDDVSDGPTWLREIHSEPVDAKHRAAALSQYQNGLGSLIAVDRMVGKIKSHLKRLGKLKNTVFIFSSDNGFSFGSHHVVGKLVPYEETVRVPLVIAGPGIPHGTNDDIVAAIDVAPTLYELGRAGDHPDVDGRSLVPLLEGKDPPWRDDLLIEYKAPPQLALHTFDQVRAAAARGPAQLLLVPDYRSIRTKRWQYIEWYSGDEHDYELYDMQRDPFQLTNLMADPATAAAHQADVRRLQPRLDALAACSGPTCRR
jgi:arylsulfatase A-like enzyme